MSPYMYQYRYCNVRNIQIKSTGGEMDWDSIHLQTLQHH